MTPGRGTGKFVINMRARALKKTNDPIARLRAICLALPDTTEKLAWGEPTWRVRERLFAQLDNHHHGAEHLAVWLPAPLGEQEARARPL